MPKTKNIDTLTLCKELRNLRNASQKYELSQIEASAISYGIKLDEKTAKWIIMYARTRYREGYEAGMKSILDMTEMLFPTLEEDYS